MIELSLPGGVRVLFTDRELGDLREPGPRAALAERAGRPLADAHQVHGTLVAEAGAGIAEADGQATARTDLAPMVRVADCLPVAIAGADRVAMVHAGWRGLAAGILEEGVRAVGAPIAAAIGPGAGPCCYEVGDDVRAAFGVDTPTADLKAIAARRLRAVGVQRVEDVGICTICDRRYYSFRREGEAAGRQAGVAWRA